MYIDPGILIIVMAVCKLLWWVAFTTWILCKRKKIKKILKGILAD